MICSLPSRLTDFNHHFEEKKQPGAIVCVHVCASSCMRVCLCVCVCVCILAEKEGKIRKEIKFFDFSLRRTPCSLEKQSCWSQGLQRCADYKFKVQPSERELCHTNKRPTQTCSHTHTHSASVRSVFSNGGKASRMWVNWGGKPALCLSWPFVFVAQSVSDSLPHRTCSSVTLRVNQSLLFQRSTPYRVLPSNSEKCLGHSGQKFKLDARRGGVNCGRSALWEWNVPTVTWWLDIDELISLHIK